MYTSFSVKNYRCFVNLTLEPLARVNLIAGKNNVGKTALLEALWLHQGYHNPELAVRVDLFRGLERIRIDEFLWDLFTDFNPEQVIELASKDNHGKSKTLRIKLQKRSRSRTPLGSKRTRQKEIPIISTEALVQQNAGAANQELVFEYQYSNNKPQLRGSAFIEDGDLRYERPSQIKEPNAIFLSARRRDSFEELAQRLSYLAVAKRQNKIIEVLRIIQPDLHDLTVQYASGTPVIYGDVGKARLLPLPLMGDGLGRLLSIALAIPQAENGLVLIDEIENGLYFKAMSKVWQTLALLAGEFNTQIFATTHSYECIQSAHQAFEEEPSCDFCLHRLEEIQDRIQSVTYDRETLSTAIESGWEVR
jgi:AAA15 family ATPase/GTPase